jgi:hypothetical protein
MNSLDTRRYEMLVRVREFGAAHVDLFPPSSLGGHAFAAVAAAVADLSDHAASQFSGRGWAREGTTSKAVAREGLRDQLDSIVRTARAIALDTPGLDDKFRPPRSSSDQLLLSAARAFARDATPLAARFAEHDMPETFLADLEESIKEFELAIRDHDAGRDIHVAAGAGIETAMDIGLTAVRRLDAIVPNRLRDDAAKTAVWERARRVEYRGPRAKSEPEVENAEASASDAAAAT